MTDRLYRALTRGDIVIMTSSGIETFNGPYVRPRHTIWGLALVVAFGALSVMTLSVQPWILLMTLPLTAYGARLLYLGLTRTPIQCNFYTLAPEGLKYAPPEAPDLIVPWAAMQRLETTAANPNSLRLHFVAVNVANDPVPKLGHKINEVLLGNAYRRWRADQVFEPVAQVLGLNPSASTTEGAKFGERLPVWFARYASAEQPSTAGIA